MKIETPGWVDRAEAEAERLIPRLEAVSDHAGLAKVWRMLSWVYGSRGSLTGWDEASHRSIAHARLAGDRREEIEVAAGLTIAAAYGPIHADEGLRRCLEILADVRGNARAEAFVLEHVAFLQAMTGRFDDARASIDRAVDLFDEIEAFGHALGTALTAAEVELLAGDVAAAVHRIRQIYQLRPQWRLEGKSELLDLYLARALCEQDGPADELPLPDIDAHTDYADAITARAVGGRVLARRGELTEAETLVRSAVERADESDDMVLQGEAAMALGDVLQLAGKRDEAMAAFDRAADIWDRKGYVVMSERARRASAEIARG
jgi:tetratricopeptide (TPR) repeat protein